MTIAILAALGLSPGAFLVLLIPLDDVEPAAAAASAVGSSSR